MSMLKIRALSIVIVVFAQNLNITAVYWNQAAIIWFGDSATLTCLVEKNDDCDSETTRRWDGGLDNTLLLFNGLSSNRNKYVELAEEPCKNFSLVILNFEENDMNCSYSCSFGFESSGKQMLNLSEDNFIKTPSEKNVDLVLDLKTEIQMSFYKVYPIPSCTTNIGLDARLVLEVLSVSVETPGGMFYNVTLRKETNIKYDQCHNNVTVNCKLLSFSFLQMHERFNCTEQTSDAADKSFDSTIIIVISLVVPCVIISIGVTCVKCCYSRNTTANNTDSDLEISTRKFHVRRKKRNLFLDDDI